MKKLIITLVIILTVMLNLAPFRALADDGKLTAEDAIKTLQSINSNIANYDMKTHLVTFKDGSKPEYITPKGEHPQNGEVTWDYFIEQKGDLRGWLKYSVEEIIKRKREIKIEFEKNNGVSSSDIQPFTSYYPDYYTVGITQYPQQHSNWCGPAATQSVLSGWGITNVSQSTLANEEGIPNGNEPYGASYDSIANALNNHTNSTFYQVTSFGIQSFETGKQELWNIILMDIGDCQEALVGCVDTIYLTDWRNNVSDGKTLNRVHYIGIRGYQTPVGGTPVQNDWPSADINYTDSATSIHPNLHAYCWQDYLDRNNDGGWMYKALYPYKVVS
jgi:hypothetical protein